MDPYYFLDLESSVVDEDDYEVEMYELDSTIYPGGSWDLSVGNYSGYIIYGNENFKILEFCNSNKELTCFYDINKTEKKVFKLMMMVNIPE